MSRRALGFSLVAAVWITALSSQAPGKPEKDQPTSRATRDGRMIVAGNTPAPGGKGGLAPPRLTSVQRAPEGTAKKLIDAQASRAIRRELFRRHYQRPGRDYCKRNSHRPNFQQ